MGKVTHWELCKFKNLAMLTNSHFEIQTDYQISARRPNLFLIKKKKRTCQLVDFVIVTDYRVKIKESKKNRKITGSSQKKKLEIRGKIGTIQTTANILKSPGDLRRHVVIQTSVKTDFKKTIKELKR